MEFNRASKHRLFSQTRGVIGPPGLDSDNIIEIDLYSEKRVIEWKTAGAQIVDCSDAQLQEFADHDIAWKELVEGNWRCLLDSAHPIISNNSKFVLLTGLPGGGKTTLARKLSSRTGWLHFDFADFSHKVIGVPPLMLNDYTRVGEHIEKKINEAIKNGISIIYDTTAPSALLRQHIIRAAGCADESYVVYVPTKPEICVERVALRRQPPDSRDLRPGIYRSDARHLRTIADFLKDYEVPADSVLADNECDLDSILVQLKR